MHPEGYMGGIVRQILSRKKTSRIKIWIISFILYLPPHTHTNACVHTYTYANTYTNNPAHVPGSTQNFEKR
jgi:hypothetical protein